MDIILTEVLEESIEHNYELGAQKKQNLSPIDYSMELIESKEGKLYWEE